MIADPQLPVPTTSAEVDTRPRTGEPPEGEVRFNRAGRQEFYWRGRWRAWSGHGE